MIYRIIVVMVVFVMVCENFRHNGIVIQKVVRSGGLPQLAAERTARKPNGDD